MTNAGFDFAPVTRHGEVCGYVHRADLVDQPGMLAPHIRPLTASRQHVRTIASRVQCLPSTARPSRTPPTG
ncbi:hypothetical protein Nm8I071_38060 [Nonomuraea sp. TT08I-71]|nr:hypothetical protein Nm8I071_38060 [Nonomuraea sp. TT08I-71]